MMLSDPLPPRSADVRLVTADDLSLAARIDRPANFASDAAIVIAHGVGAHRDEPNVRALADAAVQRGFLTVTYDARGHGASDGLCTLGTLECFDVAAAVQAARHEAARVIVVGASMGAVAVLRYAVTDPNLDGVVTVSGPAEWRVPRTARGLLSVAFTRTGAGRRVAARHLNVRLAPGWDHPAPPVDLAAQLSQPLAVVHGRRDRFIPVAQARTLFAAAGGARRLDLVPRMGHAFQPEGLHTVLAAARWAFAVSAGVATTTPDRPDLDPCG